MSEDPQVPPNFLATSVKSFQPPKDLMAKQKEHPIHSHERYWYNAAKLPEAAHVDKSDILTLWIGAKRLARGKI
jgi:hypothetical protein